MGKKFNALVSRTLKNLVDSDDRGSGGVKNGIAPSNDMPGQSLLSDVFDESIKTEIGLAIDIEHIPSDKNIWILPELSISKA